MQKIPLWKILIFYGIFLFVLGIIGFLSNPEKAKTALISGGTFGGLSIIWGILYRKGQRWGLLAALATLVLLIVAFTWRAVVSWIAYFGGNPAKLLAAVLITAMLLVSLGILPRVIKAFKRD